MPKPLKPEQQAEVDELRAQAKGGRGGGPLAARRVPSVGAQRCAGLTASSLGANPTFPRRNPPQTHTQPNPTPLTGQS